jgi:SAM-dependent methyltransferase
MIKMLHLLTGFILRSARYGKLFFSDLLTIVRRGKLVIPPTRLMRNYGTSDIKTFLKNGEDFYEDCRELGKLKPSDSVLDIGCGIGEKTRPLVGYLIGQYEGVDIIKVGVDWCRKRISPKHPNFHFQVIDVYSQFYNPKGTYEASEYKFPFKDESFDFIYLGSVFTHMLPADVENYVFEIARMLKKRGRCLATFFLLNSESRELISAGKSTLDFKHTLNEHMILSKEQPEAAICYDETYVLTLFRRAGLITANPVYGSWCERKFFRRYQDYVLGVKN